MSVSEAEPVVVGVDVGGSKVLAGVVTADGRVRHTVRTTTPGRRVASDLVEETVVTTVREVAAGRPLAAVGVAAAGFVDAARERVLFAPHLPWNGEPVRERLSSRLGVPVVLDNDANCAAVAEGRYGAAAGAPSAVVLTLGTGIGGAVLLDGHLWRGRNGMAGEFGHVQVVPDGLPCECGGRGCWEQYCSGNALVREARSRLDGRSSRLAELCLGRPELLTGPMVSQAAEEGDPLAGEAFASVARWLGTGLANLVAALDPHVVVVGGGLSAAGERLLGPARTALERSLVAGRERTAAGAPVRELPDVLPAALGPLAGLVGAAALAAGAPGRGAPVPADSLDG